MLSYLPCPLPDYLPYTAAGSPPGPVEALLDIARAMPRGSHGPAGPRVKSSPRSPQAAYPTPPDRPTLHRAPRAPALHLPTDLPYTRPAPPKSPALHLPAGLPAGLPCTALPGRPPCTSQPTYPTPAACQTADAARSADTQSQSLLVSRPTYPTPRPGHEKTTKSRSHNNHTPESSL
jgi:hypothetical protein